MFSPKSVTKLEDLTVRHEHLGQVSQVGEHKPACNYLDNDIYVVNSLDKYRR